MNALLQTWRRPGRLLLTALGVLSAAASLRAGVRVEPWAPVLVAGETLTFRAHGEAPGACVWRWSLVEPEGGCVDPGTGQYQAPEVPEPRTFHVRTSLADHPERYGEAAVTVLPRGLFEDQSPGAPCPAATFPFLLPGQDRRFGAGFLVRYGTLPLPCSPCGTKVVEYGQPVTLTWAKPGSTHRALLTYREGQAMRCLEVTGRDSVTLCPRGRISACHLEVLAHGPRPGTWVSACTRFCISVQGVMPFAGEAENGTTLREPVGLMMLGGDLFVPMRLVVADAVSHRLLALSGSGEVQTAWGRDLEAGHRDGPPEEARFNQPTFLTVDRRVKDPPGQHSCGFLVADSGNHVLRKVDGRGEVSTLAGTPGLAGFLDAARPGQARFNRPQGLVMDDQGWVFVADQGNHVVRRVAPDGRVSTLAGMPGQPGTRDGQGREARFSRLVGLTEALDGNLYVVDGHALRRVAKDGTVTTVLGDPERPGFQDRLEPRALDDRVGRPCLCSPGGVRAHGRCLVIADRGNHALRAFDRVTGALRTLAGDPGCPELRFGSLREGGAAEPLKAGGATLREPRGLAVGENGGLWVSTGTCVVWVSPPSLPRPAY